MISFLKLDFVVGLCVMHYGFLGFMTGTLGLIARWILCMVHVNVLGTYDLLIEVHHL